MDDRDTHGRAGVVQVLAEGGAGKPPAADLAGWVDAAHRIARLLGYDYRDPGERIEDGKHTYFVPGHTLLQPESAAHGIRSEADLFGGVVPHPFVATKTVTHPVCDEHAFTPEGWPRTLASNLLQATLAGFSAFTVSDAQRAGERLLEKGPVRVKPADGIAGEGQSLATTAAELTAALTSLDPRRLRDTGVVLEQQLEAVRTYSIGQARVGDMRIAYHGTQRLTTNRAGHEVYGGSDLIVFRGTMQDLLGKELPAELRLAIEQAIRYDAAMENAFPGFFASRRNYDVACGTTTSGEDCSGVLEQSWRIGGASPAELSAMEAFASEPGLQRVHAATHEEYGLPTVPAGAHTWWRGESADGGPLTKYCFRIDDGN